MAELIWVKKPRIIVQEDGSNGLFVLKAAAKWKIEEDKGRREGGGTEVRGGGGGWRQMSAIKHSTQRSWWIRKLHLILSGLVWEMTNGDPWPQEIYISAVSACRLGCQRKPWTQVGSSLMLCHNRQEILFHACKRRWRASLNSESSQFDSFFACTRQLKECW